MNGSFISTSQPTSRRQNLRVFTVVLSLLAAIIMLSTGSALANDDTKTKYRLGSGDKIAIHVFGEEDLSIESYLSDMGTVSFPLLGEITAKNITPSQLETRITDLLRGDYLVNPKVNVSILEYRQIYVNGEVKKPGGFPFIPGLTVRKAISIAGGYSDRASKDNVSIIPENDPEDEHDVELDSLVNPGDIITVKESFF